MTDAEAMELLKHRGASIEFDTGGYRLIINHGPISLEQLERLVSTSRLKLACNGASLLQHD